MSLTRQHLRLGPLALVLIAFCVTLKAVSQATMTPREILSRMKDVYATCMTYRDEGKVVSGAGGELTFATIFARPSQFRYEYKSRSRSDYYVIWRTEPGDAKSWWTIRRETRTERLGLAIAGATGVSAATSHTIPTLLMPDELQGGFSLALDNWVDTGPVEETVGGRLCYKLSGHYPLSPTSPLTVWIDKETFLVRQVFSNSTTVTYSPQLNVPIEPSTFQYQPPLGSR